ncbi:MAG TPA: ATP-binding cassette domain-containing protein [Gammaproteobacteria bacterium]|nr:ATP-binding cassette domain-containing protein [Gammaproteobacteria bacterium]
MRNFNLELSQGEILGLLGPNGAGKSTTMRILSGCLGASLGDVWLDGFDLFKEPLQAKQAIGYLPENPPLYPELTVDEYLLFCARLRAVRKSETSAALDRAKALCGLGREGSRLIRNLSKGFQQRVGIAQAIIHKPRVIILDEPTSGLDPNQIIEIRELIRTLGESHGVILSTHILPEVQSVCDRVLILNNGRTVYTEYLAKPGHGKCDRLRVRLACSPGESAMAALQGVVEVTVLGESRFSLLLDDSCSTEAVAKQIIQQDWGLLELVPDKQNLEQIFYRLTTADEVEG